MSDYLKRGNLMWEGSRMMLPEHIQALRNRKKSKKQDPRPSLEEDDLTEFSLIATDSLNHMLHVTVVYWRDGFDQEITGVIDHMDHHLKRLKINGQWIHVRELKKIEKLS
ncbi:YolD-like family protein [Salipaludibacillus sp. HK11]|uniref:YolD-like family protein n=1 Tax=Salipaludibacillus sp. HK11 TaxID=3394320 RepID=UPI0039FD25A5